MKCLLSLSLAAAVLSGCGGRSELDLTRRSAERGEVLAQHNLGLMYSHGHGVARNHAEAFKWFCRAADQGYARAQHNLGLMYSTGLGVAEDDEQAVQWYLKSAEQGYARAQYAEGPS